jgi:hypothetical protein
LPLFILNKLHKTGEKQMMNPTIDEVKQAALKMLIANFMSQGHPAEYAQHMATATIFQTDLELRNAQLLSLLGWLQQNYPEVHVEAVQLLETTRAEFERRVQG